MFPKFSWAAASGDNHPLVVHAPNMFFEDMRKTFGPFPLTLTTGDIPTLREMAQGSVDELAYTDLITALQGYGTLTVIAKG